jgi:hypothetical protein
VAHVAHRVWVMAGRRGADAQAWVPTIAVTIVADAIMISRTGRTTTARNLTAGRTAVLPRTLGLGKSKRNAWPVLASTRRSQGCGTSCSVRGNSSPLVSWVKIANLEARRGSPALSAFSIALRARSWQAGKLISLLLFRSALAQWPRQPGSSRHCVT